MRGLTRSGRKRFQSSRSPGARYLEVEVFSESALVELLSSGNFRQESLRRSKLRQAEIPLTTRLRDASVARCASDGAASQEYTLSRLQQGPTFGRSNGTLTHRDAGMRTSDP